MIAHEQSFKSTRKHATERQINGLGAYILQAGFPCLNALENGACVLRRLAAFLGRFVSYPYKVSTEPAGTI